jgi:TRAP-type C4-dicarboxylate transport system permease small subunit
MSLMTIWRKLRVAGTLMSYIGSVALFVMMAITVADVIGRYVFNSPILGVFELTEFLVLILIFSFIAYTQAGNGHISVDFMVKLFPRRFRLFTEMFNHSICLILMGAIGWFSFLRAMELKRVGETSLNLAIPDYPFVFFLVLGCLVMCVEYIRKLIRLWVDRKAGAES